MKLTLKSAAAAAAAATLAATVLRMARKHRSVMVNARKMRGGTQHPCAHMLEH